jgi:hypothetical protein
MVLPRLLSGYPWLLSSPAGREWLLPLRFKKMETALRLGITAKIRLALWLSLSLAFAGSAEPTSFEV